MSIRKCNVNRQCCPFSLVRVVIVRSFLLAMFIIYNECPWYKVSHTE